MQRANGNRDEDLETIPGELIEESIDSGSGRRRRVGWVRTGIGIVALLTLLVVGHDLFSVRAFERSRSKIEKALMKTGARENLTEDKVGQLVTGFPSKAKTGSRLVYTWRGVIHRNGLELLVGNNGEVLALNDDVTDPADSKQLAMSPVQASMPPPGTLRDPHASDRPKTLINGIPKLIMNRHLQGKPMGVLAKGSENVLVVDAHNPDYLDQEQRLLSGSLIREIGRQALLMAGRDGLALSTKDRMLREHTMQIKEVAKFPFTVVTAVKVDGTANVGVYQLKSDGWHVHFEKEFKIPVETPYEPLVEKFEAWSRTDFEPLLTKNQYRTQKVTGVKPTPVPEGLRTQLDVLDEFSQYAAVRQLHEFVRTHGETAERLGLLSRGYANLGMLTRNFWSAAPKVCMARSLLYAERGVVSSKRSPEALRDRAYARALAGLHRSALLDLEAASQAAPKSTEPDWVAVIRAYAHGDDEALVKLGSKKSYRPLARLLRMLTHEFTSSHQEVQDLAKSVFEELPGNLRASEILAETTGLGGRGTGAALGEVGLVTALYPVILEMSDLPAELRTRINECPGLVAAVDAARKEVRGAVKKPADAPDVAGFGEQLPWNVPTERELRRDLVRAFRAKGKSFEDRSEPSLATLAHLIEEHSVLQAYREIEWSGNWFSVPVTDLIGQLQPIIEDHPFRRRLDLFQLKHNPGERKVAAQDLSESIDLLELEYPMSKLIQAAATSDMQAMYLRNVSITGHDDAVLPDRLYGMGWSAGMPRKVREREMAGLTASAPEARATIMARIQHTEESSQRYFREWEEKYKKDHAIQMKLVDAYRHANQLEDGERILKRMVESAPTFALYQKLAGLYSEIGDTSNQLKALVKALEYPSEGLDSSNVNMQIARIYMDKGDYKGAQPYALRAAESGAGWGMSTAAEVHEQLGEWDKAEALYRGISERYQDSGAEWYHWCLRTGRGDVKAAREVANKYLSVLKENGLSGQITADRAQKILAKMMQGRMKRILGSIHREESGMETLRLALTVGRGDIIEEVLEKAWKPDLEEPSRGLYGWSRVLLAHARGNPTERDAMMVLLQDVGKPTSPRMDRHCAEFARRIKEDFAKPKGDQLDLPSMERLVNSMPSEQISMYWFVLGWYLDARGRSKDAVKYMEWSAGGPNGVEQVPTMQLLAARYLREHDLPIPKDRVHPAAKLSWPDSDGASRILSDSIADLRRVQYSADGKLLAAGGGDNRLYVWNVEKEKPQLIATLGDAVSSTAGITQFSPDGKLAAILKYNNTTVEIWEVATGKRSFSLTCKGVAAPLAAFSPDSKTLAVYCTTRAHGRNLHGEIAVWDLATHLQKKVVPAPDAYLDTMAFLPGTQDLLVGGEAMMTPRVGFLSRYPEMGMKRLDLLSERSVQYNTVTLSPEGDLIATQLVQGRFQLIRRKTMEIVGSIYQSETSGAVAPLGGSLVAMGMQDGSIAVWDFASGEVRAQLNGHLRPVNSLTVSPDGKTLASGSDDLTVRLWDLTRLPPAPPRVAGRLPSKIVSNSLGMKFVPIHAGEFQMGESNDFEHGNGYGRDDLAAERPQHHVKITRDFYLGQHEVTVAQFREFVKATGYVTYAEKRGGSFLEIPSAKQLLMDIRFNWKTPGFTQTDDHPVVQLTWDDAQSFCAWLSEKEKVRYRLPTEAEWEYACRAGTRDQHSFEGNAIIRYANGASNELRETYNSYPVAITALDGFTFTSPIGTFAPNAWGLYDMHGNAFEYCSDLFDTGYYRRSPVENPKGGESSRMRVHRGGSWMHHSDDLRSAHREGMEYTDADGSSGFRVVKAVE